MCNQAPDSLPIQNRIRSLIQKLRKGIRTEALDLLHFLAVLEGFVLGIAVLCQPHAEGRRSALGAIRVVLDPDLVVAGRGLVPDSQLCLKRLPKTAQRFKGSDER